MLDRISSVIDEKGLQSYRYGNYYKLLAADFDPVKKAWLHGL